MGQGRQAIARQCRDITNRINALPESARVAIAVAAAQRLMDAQISASEEQRSEFAVGWAPSLSLIWQQLVTPSVEADKVLRDRLKAYYSGPYSYKLGDEALPGADEDVAAAAIYANEAYCLHSAKSAACGALSLVEAACLKADELNGDLMSPEAEAREVLFEQKEIDRLTAALVVLEREGATQASLEELRRIFEIRSG
jgi:hypothetical protein